MISMLCVGDVEKSLSRYTKILSQNSNFSIEVCSSPAEALDRMKTTSYDAILSDYLMPGMNGIEFLTVLRSTYGDIPFILNTGNKEQVAQDALSYGADYCLTDHNDINIEYSLLIHVIIHLVESREAKKALQDSIAQLYHDEFIAGLGHWEYLMDTRMVIMSHGARAIYGLEDREWSISDIQKLVLPEFLGRVDKALDALLHGKASYNLEYQIKRDNDGKIIDIHSIAEYDPRANRVFGIIQDISERKTIERALSLSESKFRLLVENINDVIFSVDVRGNIMYFSPAGERLFGYKSPDLAGRLFLDVVYPEDRQILLKRFEELGRGILTPLEWRLIKKDGSLCWVRTSTRPVSDTGGNPRFFGVITDISREKEALTALMESEEKYRFLVDHSIEGIIILDLEGNLLFANQAAMHIVGINDFSLLSGRNVLEFIAPESVKQVITDIGQVSSGKDAFLAEYLVKSISGKKIWIECIGKLIRYQNQDADLLSVRDITERKSAEEELKASEERFRSFVEHAYDIVYSLTPEGVFTYVSPNWSEVLGHNTEDIPGFSFQEVIHPDDVPVVMEFLKDIVSAGNKGGGIEYRIRHMDGSWRWQVSNVTPIYNTDGSVQAYLGIAHDVTDRKQSEMALRQANRQLNLVSSITRHDILNQVMTIFAYLDSAQQSQIHPEMNAFIEKIETCTCTIQSHIEFTKTYEGLGLHEPEWQDLIDCIPQLNISESLRLEVHPSNLQIFADPMLKKVFYNLLDNSLRHGQQVSLVCITSHKAGDDFVIIFEDDGVGIPDTEKELIFERGFGKNTGLGLFLARDILSLTGISIQERGEAGKGALFEMRVPKGAWRFT